MTEASKNNRGVRGNTLSFAWWTHPAQPFHLKFLNSRVSKRWRRGLWRHSTSFMSGGTFMWNRRGTNMQPVHEVNSLNTFLNRCCQSEEVEEVLGGDLIPDLSKRDVSLKPSGRILSDRAVCHLNQNPMCVIEALNGSFQMLLVCHRLWWKCGSLFFHSSFVCVLSLLNLNKYHLLLGFS